MASGAVRSLRQPGLQASLMKPCQLLHIVDDNDSRGDRLNQNEKQLKRHKQTKYKPVIIRFNCIE